MAEQIRIPNIENYDHEIIDGVLVLTPKVKTYLCESELLAQITHSKIVACLIKQGEEIITTNKTYRSVLIDIWKSMPTQKVLHNTTFNFKLTNERGVKGYEWCDEIRMSFQHKDSKGTIKEILHMVKVNNLTIDLSIRLGKGEVVYFTTE